MRGKPACTKRVIFLHNEPLAEPEVKDDSHSGRRSKADSQGNVQSQDCRFDRGKRGSEKRRSYVDGESGFAESNGLSR